MNTDIRFKTSFFEHLKTKKLLTKYGAEGVVGLMKLWLYTAQYRPEGRLTDMTKEDLSIITETETDFIDYLVEIKFLDLMNDVYSVHNWETHNGFCASHKVRSEKARENAKKRWTRNNTTNNKIELSSEPYASGMQTLCDPHTLRYAPSPSPIPNPSPNPSPNPNKVFNKFSTIENQKDTYKNDRHSNVKTIKDLLSNVVIGGRDV